MSRSVNSFKNLLSLYICQVVTLVLNFIVRSFLIKYLGEEYLGIHGLFTNILSVLSLAELGVGTAIIFKLYKPIEEKNQRRIQLLLKLYKTVYSMVGWFVAAVGLLLIPFLKYIIQDYQKLEELGIHVMWIFLLYIFNSASSYWFFAYKQAIVEAHQKKYKLTIWGQWLAVASGITQIIVLKYTKNFLLYTMTMIFFNVLTHFVFAKLAEHMYPYIKEKTEERITREETKELFKDCGALLLYKINTAVISASDNIVLSVLMGIKTVGLYSNYRVIFVALKDLYWKFFEAIGPSVGSIHATGNLVWKRNIYRIINFIMVWIHAIGAVCIAVVCDEFIEVWIGEKYTIGSFWYNQTIYVPAIRYLMAIEVFLHGYNCLFVRFRNSFGLFRQLKYRPIATMSMNLIVSLCLVPYIGVAGVIIGTIAASLVIYIVDPIIIHRCELKTSLTKYFLKNFLYLVVAVGSVVVSEYICSLTAYGTWTTLIMHGIICVVTTSVLYGVLYCRSSDFKMLIETMKSVWKKRGNSDAH